MNRGDRIGPVDFGNPQAVAVRPSARDVAGVIAATLDHGVGQVGQGHLVFVDKGRRDGVEPGNTFTVVRATDGLDDDGLNARFASDMPSETIGELLVVDVQSAASTALVTRSSRELRVGDKVRMKTRAGE
jgi:hypothetical protein